MSRQVKIRVTDDEYIQLEKEASALNLSVAALAKIKVVSVEIDKFEKDNLIAESIESLSAFSLESNELLNDIKTLLKLNLTYSLSTVQIAAHDSDEEGKGKIKKLVELTRSYAEEIMHKAGVK